MLSGTKTYEKLVKEYETCTRQNHQCFAKREKKKKIHIEIRSCTNS